MFNLQNGRCRLCGSRSLNLISIELNLTIQINVLFHVKVSTCEREDKLSKRICSNCVFTVNTSWTFYQQVQNVQKELTEGYIIKDEPLSKDDLLKPTELEVFVAEPLNDHKTLVKVEPTHKIVKRKELLVKPTEKIIKTKTSSTKRSSKKRRSLKFNEDSLVKRKTKDAFLDPDESWSDYPWWCRTCGKHFDHAEAYKKHPCFKAHRRYFCVDCSKAFIIYNKLITHIKEFHWDRLKMHLLLQCDVCTRWFNSKQEQETHREEEHPDADNRVEPELPASFSFTCQVCGKTCVSRKSLRQHALLHCDELPHVCDICDKGFHFASGLTDHKLKFHTEPEQMLHCDQCAKRFPTKSYLKTHMIMHAKDRPFACDICHKTFKSKQMVKLHINRHSDKTPYVCDTCGKAFNCRTKLTRHRNRHTKQRTHKCPYCEKAFKLKEHLTNHERQHTGEQPYSCPLCERKFTCNGNKVKHMNRIHKIYEDMSNRTQEKFEETIFQHANVVSMYLMGQHK